MGASAAMTAPMLGATTSSAAATAMRAAPCTRMRTSRACVLVRMHVGARERARARVCMLACARARASVDVCAHPYTRSHNHARTHTRAHERTCAPRYPARLVASQPLPSPLTCVSWSPPLGAADSASVDAGRCSCLLAAVGASRRLDIFRAPTRAELTCDWVRIFDATAALASAADEVLTPTETIASAAGGGAAGAAAQRAAKRARGTPHPGRGRAAARAALCCAWSAAFSRDACGAPASLLAVGTEAGTVLLLRHGVSGDGANQFALAGALRLSESFVTAIEWAGPVPAEGGRIERAYCSRARACARARVQALAARRARTRGARTRKHEHTSHF